MGTTLDVAKVIPFHVSQGGIGRCHLSPCWWSSACVASERSCQPSACKSHYRLSSRTSHGGQHRKCADNMLYVWHGHVEHILSSLMLCASCSAQKVKGNGCWVRWGRISVSRKCVLVYNILRFRSSWHDCLGRHCLQLLLSVEGIFRYLAAECEGSVVTL